MCKASSVLLIINLGHLQCILFYFLQAYLSRWISFAKKAWLTLLINILSINRKSLRTWFMYSWNILSWNGPTRIVKVELKWIAHTWTEPMTLALLAPCSSQLNCIWSRTKPGHHLYYSHDVPCKLWFDLSHTVVLFLQGVRSICMVFCMTLSKAVSL